VENITDYLAKEQNFKETLGKIADHINAKRRHELATIMYSDNVFKDWVIKQRKGGPQKSKSKVWRKVATLPVVVDQFFQRVYGEDYYKDKDFFERYGSEWKV
jgi:hypothetical protein